MEIGFFSTRRDYECSDGIDSIEMESKSVNRKFESQFLAKYDKT
jgi:hypothetical protein